MDSILYIKLCSFMESEARSGSMDFGFVMPLYVYSNFGGEYSTQTIEGTQALCKKVLYE